MARVFGSVVVLCALVVPSLAQAEAGGGLQGAISRLQGEDAEAVVAAVRQLGDSGSAAAVQPLVQLLESGPPDAVTHAALEALGAIGNTSAIDTLVGYVHHRRSEARVIALQSLSGMRGSRVESALMDALRDSNAEVRSTAATALGEGSFTDSVQVLFQAFDRGVSEACAAIGKLGDRAAAERLAGYLGRGDLPTLLEGLGEFMARSDFDPEAKRMLVERLLELAGPQVREFLVGQLAEMADVPRNRRLRQDIEAAIAQIPEE